MFTFCKLVVYRGYPKTHCAVIVYRVSSVSMYCDGWLYLLFYIFFRSLWKIQCNLRWAFGIRHTMSSCTSMRKCHCPLCNITTYSIRIYLMMNGATDISSNGIRYILKFVLYYGVSCKPVETPCALCLFVLLPIPFETATERWHILIGNLCWNQIGSGSYLFCNIDTGNTIASLSTICIFELKSDLPHTFQCFFHCLLFGAWKSVSHK